jgi:signal recognition particle GTPase
VWLVPAGPPGSHPLAPDAQAEPTHVVYIMRGLPGAGKSTRAAAITAAAAARGAACAVHSTDSFFVDARDGVYRFDVTQLSANHDANHAAFVGSLNARVPVVIVDNTNIEPWHFERYVIDAWAAGYAVREELVGEFNEAAVSVYAARNVHGVPHDKLLVMLDAWRQQLQ